MYKFNYQFYIELKDYALKCLGGLEAMKYVHDRNLYFSTYIGKLEEWNEKKQGVQDLAGKLREAHNAIYEKMTKKAQFHIDNTKDYQQIVNYMSEVRIN
jgi:hypothetical protein